MLKIKEIEHLIYDPLDDRDYFIRDLESIIKDGKFTVDFFAESYLTLEDDRKVVIEYNYNNGNISTYYLEDNFNESEKILINKLIQKNLELRQQSKKITNLKNELNLFYKNILALTKN